MSGLVIPQRCPNKSHILVSTEQPQANIAIQVPKLSYDNLVLPRSPSSMELNSCCTTLCLTSLVSTALQK